MNAIDSLLSKIDARIAACVPSDRDFADLLAELREERTDPNLARACKLEALAGFDPGMAPDEWLRTARGLAEDAGQSTGDEVVAAAPILQDGIVGARKAIEAMKYSNLDIRIESEPNLAEGPLGELPWQRGRRLAAWFRSRHSLGDGRVATAALEQLLDVRLPMPATSGPASRALTGGYRNGHPKGRTRIVVGTDRIDNQRFYLGRLLGASLAATPDDHVLPVTNAATAFQKFERSFAQELLCPWTALDEFTDEHGTDDDGIASAADYFGVSELLVISTLVNNGKLDHSVMHEPGLSVR